MTSLEAVFPFQARPGTPDDAGYIISTFEESLWPSYRGTVRRSDFSRAAKAAILAELRRGASLLIASPEADPSVVWGWSLSSNEAVFFAYVRSRCRRARICTRLLQAAGIDTQEEIVIRHPTESTAEIRRSGKLKLRHIPCLG